jgi:hypothetical protein
LYILADAKGASPAVAGVADPGSALCARRFVALRRRQIRGGAAGGSACGREKGRGAVRAAAALSSFQSTPCFGYHGLREASYNCTDVLAPGSWLVLPASSFKLPASPETPSQLPASKALRASATPASARPATIVPGGNPRPQRGQLHHPCGSKPLTSHSSLPTSAFFLRPQLPAFAEPSSRQASSRRPISHLHAAGVISAPQAQSPTPQA